MKFLQQAVIISAITFAAEIIKYLVPLPVPASIYALCLLLVLLLTGIVKEKHIARAAGFLLNIMTMLFIPAAVGLISVWADARRMLAPLAVAIVPITVVVMAATGVSVQKIRKRRGRDGE